MQSIAVQQNYAEHNPPVSACPECGIDKESGKLSCCAAGGSWVNTCGDPGDTDFDHTWFEGILACEGISHACFARYIDV